MSFILIGDRMINLTMIVRVEHTPASSRWKSRLILTLAAGTPVTIEGDLADQVWAKCQKMACPLEKL